MSRVQRLCTSCGVDDWHASPRALVCVACARNRHPIPILSRRDIVTRINSMFSTVRICSQTHEDLLAARGRLWTELASVTPSGTRRYTSDVRAYASGYFDAMYDAQRQELEFVYRSPDGTTYSTHRDTKLHRSTEEIYQAGRGAELGTWERTHCWKHSGKPFSPWSKS